ncbi:MAG TPA: hypothetical protein VK507_16840 [Iamia sp.]|nr:hypothetical protein [Iamia sp.]
MRSRHLSKLVAGVGVAAMLAVGLTAPASAVSTPVEVIGDTWDAATESFDLDPDMNAPCPETASDLLLSSVPGFPDRLRLTGGFSQQEQIGGSGPWYQFDFDVVAADFSLTLVTLIPLKFNVASVGTNHVIFLIRIYAIGESDCERDDLLCTLAVKMTTVAGTYNGAQLDLPLSSVSPHLAEVSTPCPDPFDTWPGQTSAFDQLRLA